MNSTEDKRSARVQTLATGRFEKTVSVRFAAGCTSSQTAFQPGCNVMLCVIVWARAQSIVSPNANAAAIRQVDINKFLISQLRGSAGGVEIGGVAGTGIEFSNA